MNAVTKALIEERKRQLNEAFDYWMSQRDTSEGSRAVAMLEQLKQEAVFIEMLEESLNG